MAEETKQPQQPQPQVKAAAQAAQKPPATDPHIPADPILERAVIALKEDRWILKEHFNPGHVLCVAAGTPFAHLLRPEFYANVAKKFREFATIEVHWDDKSQFAELYVMSVWRNGMSVAVLRHYEKLKAASVPQKAADYTIAYAGPVDKHRVMRTNDNVVMHAGFGSEAEAKRWLEDYLRKIAA